MKTRRSRFIRSGLHASWAFAAMIGLLAAPSAPSAAPRAALAANQQPDTGRPLTGQVPWGSSYLSTFMQEYRIRNNISPYRNVAALERLAPNGDRMVVVTASSGTLVEDRHIVYDVYVNGNYRQTINSDAYIDQDNIPGENFHSEMLIRRFFSDQALQQKYFGEKRINPASIIAGESELSPCEKACEPMLDLTYKNLKMQYNFKYTGDNKDRASGQLSTRVRKWMRDGRPVNQSGLPLGAGSTNKVAQGYLNLQRSMFGLPCTHTESLGSPSTDGGSAATLSAFSSSDPCGDGAGTAGGLMQALTSKNLGGVDFSTLQMRYMSDDPSATGLQYAFSGQKNASGSQNTGSALSALTDNAADLRTWLALDPQEFWVNLNPTEPDRIIGPLLGATNAGRELLDADFQLKRSSASLMNPNTPLGARYWHDLLGTSSSVCYGSRMWIVPGQVQVREDGDSLYILKARLAVKAVPEHVADMPASCHYDTQADARGKRLDQTMIVPRITTMVNTAPEYAPIRRAFMARIVAQWIRDRHDAGQRTSFDSLIDSGNIGPARLQDGWQPRQVFDAYVKSLKGGQFTYKTTFRRGGATYIQKITIGGVDFTSLNPTTVSSEQMNREYPQLAQAAKSSVGQLESADGSFWLGDTIAPPSGGGSSHPAQSLPSASSGGGSGGGGRTWLWIVILVAFAVITSVARRALRRGRRTF